MLVPSLAGGTKSWDQGWLAGSTRLMGSVGDSQPAASLDASPSCPGNPNTTSSHHPGFSHGGKQGKGLCEILYLHWRTFCLTKWFLQSRAACPVLSGLSPALPGVTETLPHGANSRTVFWGAAPATKSPGKHLQQMWCSVPASVAPFPPASPAAPEEPPASRSEEVQGTPPTGTAPLRGN